MEKFDKTFPSRPFAWPKGTTWSLAGVVGSGNLEVLLERNPKAPGKFECRVESSIPGYKDSWLAALSDFASSYPVGGIKATIHDQGADPIVVTFRLRQAYDHLLKKSS
jgi:malonate decarboxylase delta subunit